VILLWLIAFPIVCAAGADTHNGGRGNAVIADASNDTLTFEHAIAA
jgi:hypothetical protein